MSLIDKNNLLFCIISIIIIVTILTLIIYYYKSVIKNESDTHVLIIPNEIDGKSKKYKYNDKSLLPSKKSNNYTFTVWLLLNMYDKSNTYKSVFHRGDSYAPQPAVWIDKLNQNLNILFYTKNIKISDNNLIPNSANYPPIHNLVVVPIKLNVWFNLAIQVNRNVVNIYINGLLIKTHILPDNIVIESNSHLFIGASGNDQNSKPLNGFNGKLSQLRYYPYSLNSTEVKTIYNYGLKPEYDPVSRAKSIFNEIDATIKGGADELGLVVKYVEKKFDNSIGYEITKLLKKSGIYGKIAELGGDVKHVMAKGLVGLGDYVDEEGKKMLYGDNWKNTIDFMIHDKKLTNESCNNRNYTPYTIDDNRKYYNLNYNCFTDATPYNPVPIPCTGGNCDDIGKKTCDADNDCIGFVTTDTHINYFKKTDHLKCPPN